MVEDYSDNGGGQRREADRERQKQKRWWGARVLASLCLFVVVRLLGRQLPGVLPLTVASCEL